MCYVLPVTIARRPCGLSLRVAGAIGAAFAIAGTVAACQPCHTVQARALPLECAPSSTFVGELHFTDATAFRSFLTDRCLGVADVAAVDALVDAVDFSTDAVVVARGARAGSARCVAQRNVDSAAVCDDGVHVAFDDAVTNAQPCPGDWTIALTIARDELRAAITDDIVADTVNF
jgi:hypothetical protein